MEDEDESSDESDNLAEDGSEEGEVIPRKVKKMKTMNKPIMSSPLKILKVASSLTGENPERKQNEEDSGLQSPDSPLDSRQSILNDLHVKNYELNYESDVFKKVSCTETTALTLEKKLAFAKNRAVMFGLLRSRIC